MSSGDDEERAVSASSQLHRFKTKLLFYASANAALPDDFLSELSVDVSRLSSASLRDGNGGREGMIAALRLAMCLVERAPFATSEPVIYALMNLERALGDLDHGTVHAALKATNRNRGRKRHLVRDEFKLRCLAAVLLSIELGDDHAFSLVFDVAHETALIVGPFKTSSNLSARNSEGHNGPLNFSPRTIRNWHEEYVTAINKAGRERFDELPDHVKAASDAIACGRFGNEQWLELQRVVWLRSLLPGNIGRSIAEIAREFDAGADTRQTPR